MPACKRPAINCCWSVFSRPWATAISQHYAELRHQVDEKLPERNMDFTCALGWPGIRRYRVCRSLRLDYRSAGAQTTAHTKMNSKRLPYQNNKTAEPLERDLSR